MKRISILLALCCLLMTSASQAAVIDWLLPKPVKVQETSVHYTLSASTTIGYVDDRLQPAAQYLSELLGGITGWTIPIVKGKGSLSLELTPSLPADGYTLQVDAAGAHLSGQSYAGVMNAIQTLRQLLPVEGGNLLPGVTIEDAPRYGWRGLMLDVSRHFFSKAEVEEFLDLMAQYKLNKLHWHLTDDQGWRIEIKRYPELTARGAWRKFNNQDKQCLRKAKTEDNTDFLLPADKLRVEQGDTLYGGYYTQQDIRDIVAYATVRGIDVIPELDMPGHMLAAVSNYKGVACFDETGWGSLFSSPVCPGKDSALEFCRNVYSEVVELFPYEYVHIGGDEVEKTNWKKCPDCQHRMQEQGLKNEEELQAWFIHQMEHFLNSKGKKMIGWDEIIEGGLSQTATVMWWRSWSKEAPSISTGQGNPIIFSPNAVFYLDYPQDKNSLPAIYQYEPNLPELSVAQQQLIMGVQGNLWAEQIPTRERLYFMAAPRMQAIAELGWCTGEKDYAHFQQRLVHHFGRLRAQHIPYRIPDLQGFYKTNAFIGTCQIPVTCLDPSAQIYYTTDGTVPTLQSKKLEGTLQLDQTSDVTFRVFRPDGKPSEITRARFVADSYSPAVQASPLEPGLQTVWHEFPGVKCELITEAPVNGTYTTPDVMIPAEAKGNIGLVITGYIQVPVDGIYTFILTSDDGSWLKVDDLMVVDMNREQSPCETAGQKALAKGLHRFEVRYFDHNGGLLQLKVTDPDGNVMDPAQLYCH